MNTDHVSRRGFLAAGTGLFVFVHATPAEAQQQAHLEAVLARPNSRFVTDVNAYLKIGADGRVTVFTGKIDMGQGQWTATANYTADELDVAYESVDVVMGDTQLCPWDSGTGGSMGIQLYSLLVRRAAAEAKAVMVQMAAEQFQAPVERLKVSAGVITDPETKKHVSYAQLVGGKRIERHIENVQLKAPSEFRLMGKPQPNWKGAADFVTGKAKYTGDFSMPGMLWARIIRPPAHGAKLKSLDTSGAEKAGARIVKAGDDLIAVLHNRWDMADAALRFVKAEWEPAATGPNDQTIFDHLIQKAPKPILIGEKGNPDEGEKLAASIVESTYYNAYVTHAAPETHTALAKFENGKLTMYASTQWPFTVRDHVAATMGMPPEDIHLMAPLLGGGFGGKSGTPPMTSRQCHEAARLARAAGVPVMLMWSRDDEFFMSNHRPAAVVKIRSGLDSSGKIVSWTHQVVGAGPTDSISVYDIPHLRATSAGDYPDAAHPPDMHPFYVGPWRGPGANTNTFCRESQMDILAAKVGQDPVEFRLKHLTDERMRRVLQAAAEKFGWKPGKRPSGLGVGIACASYRNESRAVNMVEIAVDKNAGKVQVKRALAVADLGLTVSPDLAKMQLEGGFIMGLGYALTEELHFEGGNIRERGFATYQIPRFSGAPRQVDTLLIEDPATGPWGCGEPPTLGIGAVIANAIFDATGARLYYLPMTADRVKAAIAKV